LCCVVLCRNQDAYVLAAFPAGAGGWECHVLALPVPPPRPGPNGQTEPQLPYHKVYQVLHTSAAETTHSKTHFPLPTKTPVPAECRAKPIHNPNRPLLRWQREKPKNVHHHRPAPCAFMHRRHRAGPPQPHTSLAGSRGWGQQRTTPRRCGPR
jgi:hypothetical protein